MNGHNVVGVDHDRRGPCHVLQVGVGERGVRSGMKVAGKAVAGRGDGCVAGPCVIVQKGNGVEVVHNVQAIHA